MSRPFRAMRFIGLTGAVFLAVCVIAMPSFAGRIWWDGTVDDETGPPAKLLSDNDGYWGDSIVTNVDYKYETEPTNPSDILGSKTEKFGRRLLDGRRPGDWGDPYVPVGVDNGPLAVTFDFKMRCTFTEIDLISRSKKISIKLELGDDTDTLRTIFERSIEDCPDKEFHRLILAKPEDGRFLNVTVQASSATKLDEVLAWGDAEIEKSVPEDYRPIASTANMMQFSMRSIPGIDRTSFTASQFEEWKSSIGDAANAPAVWFDVPTWDSITLKPLLPEKKQLTKGVSMILTREETDCAALALTSSQFQAPVTLKVNLTPFKSVDGKGDPAGLNGVLRVMGAIKSRNHGTNVGPLFAADNLLGEGLMERYLTNGYGIKDFPKITLSPGGSAVFWVSVTAKDANPGIYEAALSYEGGEPIPVRVEVIDVTLPKPFTFVNTYGNVTSMFPFVYSGRTEKEVVCNQAVGATVWSGLPKPGSVSEIARKNGQAIFHVMIIPGIYVHKGFLSQLEPEDLTEKDEAAIRQYVESIVQEAKDLGLSYDEWFGELWDEPGVTNSPIFGALAEIVRKIDPNIRIYCNPCFWTGSGPSKEEDVYASLEPWYAKVVDISAPNRYLLNDRPKIYPLIDADRFVRAYYQVTGECKSESRANVEFYRKMGWDTFSRGWNGWGYYSYCSPRGNAWDDLDGYWFEDERHDYMVVYPGLYEPVLTRQSESARKATEDYRLLTFLKERGKTELLDELIAAYKDGEPTENLRLRALQSLK